MLLLLLLAAVASLAAGAPAGLLDAGGVSGVTKPVAEGIINGWTRRVAGAAAAEVVVEAVMPKEPEATALEVACSVVTPDAWGMRCR